ncbi:long-chain fatty acid--CoA ligase [Salipaludibacillus keqinensis]|uniref:Long-chain fatty acid--CoA ligase n=1 Tax=Salipaludibacillus keqinensis TaxID=2045207 RepID=A0A323TDZ8_9BACI|nr:long-chain fatty acid--CoA ligase [Salipaludibacillus keqinensis]PYZ92980.1 long-chain fatty acid--CoA ligase [Salipaludibacillus keqinensis]
MIRPWHINYPKGVQKHVSIPNCSLFSILNEAYEKSPNNTAVIDGADRWNYKTLYEKVAALADSLSNKGFKQGDKMLISLFNSKEYITCYFAVQRLGGIVVQANPLYTSSELNNLIIDSEATWVVASTNQQEKIEKAITNSHVEQIFVKAKSSPTASSFEELIKEGLPYQAPKPTINPKEDIAVLQYTGGTTGKSKGVMLTHQNIYSNIYQNYHFTVKEMDKKDEKILGVAPFYHVYGMTAVLLLAMFRRTAVICVSRFEPKSLLDLIRKERPTLFSGVPTMYVSLLRHPEATEEAMQSLKLCMAGSAPLPIEIIEEFERKTGAQILEGYGLSETSPTTHRNPTMGIRKVGSIGIPVPNTDCLIVDQAEGIEALPNGEVGELLIKGPQVMKGYWRNEKETNRTLKNGWLYTGDLARMDEDGYFYIVGRKKELIIASGYNIYPVEVEQVFYEHPAINEAVVFGVPDPYRGETIYAAVVLKKGESVTQEELKVFLKKRLSVFKVPAYIEFRSELPKTSVGKILRRELQKEIKNLNNTK